MGLGSGLKKERSVLDLQRGLREPPRRQAPSSLDIGRNTPAAAREDTQAALRQMPKETPARKSPSKTQKRTKKRENRKPAKRTAPEKRSKPAKKASSKAEKNGRKPSVPDSHERKSNHALRIMAIMNIVLIILAVIMLTALIMISFQDRQGSITGLPILDVGEIAPAGELPAISPPACGLPQIYMQEGRRRNINLDDFCATADMSDIAYSLGRFEGAQAYIVGPVLSIMPTVEGRIRIPINVSSEQAPEFVALHNLDIIVSAAQSAPAPQKEGLFCVFPETILTAGDTMVIDLDDYCAGSDTMDFEAISSDNLDVRIDDSQAKIAADPDARGTGYVTLTLSDGTRTAQANLIIAIRSVTQLDAIKDAKAQEVSTRHPTLWSYSYEPKEPTGHVSVRIPYISMNISASARDSSGADSPLKDDEVSVYDGGVAKRIDAFSLERYADYMNDRITLYSYMHYNGWRLSDGRDMEEELESLATEKEELAAKLDIKRTIPKTEAQLFIAKEAESYTVEYSTPEPEMFEKQVNGRKYIALLSKFRYENLSLSASVDEIEQYNLRIYWVLNQSRYKEIGAQHNLALEDCSEDECMLDISLIKDLGLEYIDTDRNELIDEVTFTVPKVGTDIFALEQDASLSNVTTSRDSSDWIIEFRTTGAAPLTITPVDSTSFAKYLEFRSIRCADKEVTMGYKGTSNHISRYSCGSNTTIIYKLNTRKAIDMWLQFGDDKATISSSK